MKEGQNAEQSIIGPHMKDLRHAFDIGVDTEVTQHHALGFSRAPAAKNNSGEIIHLRTTNRTNKPFQHFNRGKES